jgi:hypothetical protein
VKIPPTNLQPEGDAAARLFASKVADRLATPSANAESA